MKKISKHGEQQQTIARADFTGGLNTSMTPEGIAENQLARVLNLEIDHTNGKLRTVSGTRDILKSDNICAAVYDIINGVMLIVKSDRQVYLADFDGNIGGSAIGELNGNLYPKYAAYENGVLIATGGNLQYFNGSQLLSLDSPNADDVFFRAGRIVVSSGTHLYYSGIGNENLWSMDSNVESAAKFVEIGYKDGSNLIGTVPLSNNVLLIKDNKVCYRLADEYPRWAIAQVATNVECSGRRSFAAVGDDVFILGTDEAHLIQNAYYGNVKPEDIATLVKSEIHRLPPNAQVRYVAPLAQVWCIGRDGFILVYDVLLKSWYERQFNATVLDVFTVGNDVYLVKPDRISRLDKGTFKDNDSYMNWHFMTQRLVSHYDYLLKRSKISIAPLYHEHYSGQINCGKVVLPLPVPDISMYVFGNDSPVFGNHTRIAMQGRRNANILPLPPNEPAFKSAQFVHDNRHKVFSPNNFIVESRNVFRSKYLDITGYGQGGGFFVHSITLDIAEV